MSINVANNNPHVVYTVAEGATQTVFSITFEFFDDDEVQLYVDGIIKTQGSGDGNYTITGGEGSTGTATFNTVSSGTQPVTGITGGSQVVIARNIPIERVTDFSAGSDINRAALNTQLDTLTAIAADNKMRSVRALTAPISDPTDVGTNLVIPKAADRANGFLSFDSNGNVSINSVVDLSFLTLERLDIDNVRIDGNTVSSTTGSLILAPTADVEINIPASSSLYMQRAGSTGIQVFLDGDNQQIRFINTTTSTTFSSIKSTHLGGTVSDLSLNTDGGALNLNPSNGTLVFKDNDTQRGYFDLNTAGTIKVYAGTGSGTLNTTFESSNVSIAGNLTLGGSLKAPASFTIDPANHGDNTGTLIVAGNLQVDGTTTTINSTTLTVDDLNIVLASGAADSAAANGAGITIDGASASLTYVHLTGAMTFNKDVDIGDNDIENAQKLHFTENVSLYPSDGDDSILNLQAEDTGSAQLRFITGTGSGVFRGGIVASQNNVFGLKDSNDQVFIKSQEGNLPTQIFHTYDSPSAGSYVRIEAGSNFVKLYGSEGVEAQKYKDADDTSYYLEPASTSVLATVGATQLNVDNITIDGNTISSTDTDGNINLRCNGSGVVDVDSELFVYGNAINGTSAYVQIGSSGTGGDDIRIQGPNPNFTLYDSTAVADGVAAYTGGVNFYGQKTNTAYHQYSAIRPRIINGLDSDTAKTGALHFGVSDGASSALTNIIFKVEPDGVEVAGNIVVSGTVDSRDLQTDGTKLDNIEANADVTDATNVAAAGAAMTSGADFIGDVTIKTSDGGELKLQTSDTTVGINDVLGKLSFNAPNEANGTDAILEAASIKAVAASAFTSSSNATRLQFSTGNSEAAQIRMTIAPEGTVSVGSISTASAESGVAPIMSVGKGTDTYNTLAINHSSNAGNVGQIDFVGNIAANCARIAHAPSADMIQFWIGDVSQAASRKFNIHQDGSLSTAVGFGVDSTGTVTADGLTVDGDGTFSATNPTVDIKATNGNDASLILMETTGNDFGGNGANGFRSRYDGGDNALYIQSGAETTIRNRIKVDRDTGDISFYDSLGSSQSFFWDASAERVNVGNLYLGEIFSNYDIIQATSSAGLRLISPGGSVYLDSSGSVGIGIDSPDRPVHLSSAGTRNYFKAETTGAANSSESGFEIKTPSSNWLINSLGGTDALIFYDLGNTSEAMRIDSSGNVGINSSSPTAYGLTVGSTASGSYPIQIHAGGSSTAPTAGTFSTLSNNNHGDLFIASNAYVNTNHNPVIINTHGSMGATGIMIGGNNNETIRFFVQDASVTAGTEVTTAEAMRITSAGNVGIGTSSPTAYGNSQATLVIEDDGNPAIALSDTGQTRDWFIVALGDGLGIRYADGGGSGSASNITESAFFKNNGSVGIGTSSPATAYKNALQVHGADGGGNIRITNDTTGTGTGNGFEAVVVGIDAYLIQREAAPLIFYTNNSETMRIDSSGNLGFGGVTSPQAGFGVSGCIDTNGAYFARGQIASHQTNAAVLQYGSNLTELRSYGATAGSGQMRFMVGGGGGSTDTEAMRIDASGNLLVGTTSGATNSAGFKFYNAGGTLASSNWVKTLTGTHNAIRFYHNGTNVGNIQYSDTATSYISSSDYRLKENVVELTDATDRLKQIPVHRFNFISDADTTVDGFLAHEVQTVVPEAISGTHNEVDDDGNPVYQGIDQSKLVPLLVATIKELEARITALENA